MAVEFSALSDNNYTWVTGKMEEMVDAGWEIQSVQFTSVPRNDQGGTVSVMHVWLKRETKESPAG